MFCINCGQQLQEGAKFCSNCGTPVGTATPATPAPTGPELVMTLNGHDIDLVALHDKHGLFTPRSFKINAIKDVKERAGVDLTTAKSFIDSIIDREDLIAYFADKDAKDQAAFQAEKEALGDSLYCPKCHSTAIHIDKKGYSLTKGVVGTLVLGPLGLLAGKHHSNRLRYKCLKCGHEWHD